MYRAAGESEGMPGQINMNLTMNYPAVVLEDIEAITSVVCGADNEEINTLSVTFADSAAYSVALEQWDIGKPIILIANDDESEGCGAELERGFFVAETVSPDATKLSITVTAHKESIEAIADECEMDFQSLPAATGPLERRIDWDPSSTLSWGKSLPYTTIFNNNYLNVALERAGFQSTLVFSGHLKFSFLTFSLKELWFDIMANFDADAAVSATLQASYSKSFSYFPAALEWSLVDVPGVISLGPGIAFGMQFDFQANGRLHAEAGVGFDIPAGVVHIDLRNSSLSYVSGWTPQWTSYATLDAAATVNLDVAAHLQLEMGFDLLDGVVDMSAGITAAPGIHNTFTLRGDQTISTTKLLQHTPESCTTTTNGVQLVSDFVFSINAYAHTYWSKTLYSISRRLVNKCYIFAYEGC